MSRDITKDLYSLKRGRETRLREVGGPYEKSAGSFCTYLLRRAANKEERDLEVVENGGGENEKGESSIMKFPTSDNCRSAKSASRRRERDACPETKPQKATCEGGEGVKGESIFPTWDAARGFGREKGVT